MKNLLDDPGTLIYVAFLAISLIGGYLKNLKKKRESQSEDQFEESEQTNTRFEADAIEKANNEVAAEKRIAEMKEKSEMALRAKNQRESRVRKRKEEMQTSMESESELELTDAHSESWNEDFDMKKAIIYSEILNPPYL